MGDETLNITFSEELMAEIDDFRTAGNVRKKPLGREDAVLRLVKAGYDAICEQHARAFAEKLGAANRRSQN
jgi:hypothetical protein